MSLTLNRTSADFTTCVEVIGEVDVSNADELRTMLDEIIGEGTRALTVDLSKTSYIDSTGIGVLVGAAVRCSEAEISFEVARPQRNVSRVLELLGVAEKLGVKN